jgi:hypothetical protein
MIQPVVLGSLHGEGVGASLPIFWKCSTNRVGWLTYGSDGKWRCTSTADDVPSRVYLEAIAKAAQRYPQGVMED